MKMEMIGFGKWTGLLLLGLCFFTGVMGQEEHSAIFWQGFSQDWTYNHRLNRMTDYVTGTEKESDFSYEVCHSGASGTGADSGKFVQHYSLVQTPDAQFYTGSVEIKFAGKEGESEQNVHREKLSLPPALQGKGQYYVVLNGFDLYSLEKADKLIEFEYSVLPNGKMGEDGELAVTFKGGLKVDCRSPECEIFKHTYNYSLRLYYTVIAADADFNAVEGLLHADVEWDKINEISKKSRAWFLSGKEGMGIGVPAIHSFSLKMNKEHWVQKWETSLLTGNYDVPSGEMAGESNLSFIEWTEDRKAHPDFKNFSRFSLKDAGEAEIELGISLLQFKSGKIEPKSRKGGFYWPGKNAMVEGSDGNCERKTVSGK